jgi:hypothetical protein
MIVLKFHDIVFGVISGLLVASIPYMLLQLKLRNLRGKPDDIKVQKFILQVTIIQNELDQFKHLVDIRLDFVLLPIKTEATMLDVLSNRQLIASQNRRRVKN